MKRLKEYFSRRSVLGQKKKNDDAHEAMLEEAYNDLYRNRKRIYQVNFFRGIFFGAGSALGGTIVIALIVWLLSLFVNFPLIGEYFKDAMNTIDNTTQHTKQQLEQ